MKSNFGKSRKRCIIHGTVYCGLRYRQICEILYNITESGVKRLWRKGLEFLTNGINGDDLIAGLEGI